MCFGVHPILIAAKVGIDSSTYSNYGEARVSFWEETLGPSYKRLEDKINQALAPEFGNVRAQWDFSRVQALQDKERVKRVFYLDAYGKGGITVNEFRAGCGFPVVVGGDVFLRTGAQTPVPAELEQEPATAARPRKALKAPTPNTPGGGDPPPQPDPAPVDQLQDKITRYYEGWYADVSKDLDKAPDDDAREKVLAEGLVVLAAWLLNQIEKAMIRAWDTYAGDPGQGDESELADALAEARGFVKTSLVPDIRKRVRERVGAWEAGEFEGELEDLHAAVAEGLGSLTARVASYAGLVWGLMNRARKWWARTVLKDPLCRWEGPMDRVTCPGCAVQVSAGERRLSKTPPIGSQDCLDNCRHWIAIEGIDY
jgi:hypothetical protein